MAGTRRGTGRGRSSVLVVALFAALLALSTNGAAASVALDGVVTVSTGGGTQFNTLLAYNSTDDNFLTVFQEAPTNPFFTRSQVVSKTGLPIGGTVLVHDPADRTCTGCGDQHLEPENLTYNPALNEYLLTWFETASTCADRGAGDAGARVCGQRLDAAGRPVGAAVTLFEISGCTPRETAVAANSAAGEYFMVSWLLGPCEPYGTDARPEIVARRFSATLSPIGGILPISDTTDSETRTRDPSVAYNSVTNEFFVTWLDIASGVGTVRGRIMTASGSPEGAPFVVASPAGFRSEVAVDKDGSYALITSDGGIGAATSRLYSSAGVAAGTTPGLDVLRTSDDIANGFVALAGGGWMLDDNLLVQFTASGVLDGASVGTGVSTVDLAVAADGTVLAVGGSGNSTKVAVFVPLGPGGFADVSSTAFYAEAVGWLKNEGITTGTSATTYSPDNTVTRGQMAAFLWRLVGEPAGSAPHGFADVSEGAFYDSAVSWLKAEGITTGTSATTYSPDDAVTRGQMAAFLWRLADKPTGSAPHGFGDVSTGAFYDLAVAWLKDQGITTGTGPSSYSPGNAVTRGQMAAFLFRMATDSEWVRPT